MALSIASQKGQAAITDAMYFLIIATALSAFLFSFSVSFGSGLDEKVARQEFQQYTSSALKTILYTSVPRDAAKPLAGETDFLLAGIKEDYFDDRSLFDSKFAIQNSVHAAMLPLAPSYDYIFYFYVNENVGQKLPFFMYWKSEFETRASSDPRFANDPRYVEVESAGHSFYFCNPRQTEPIEQLLFAIPNEARTSGRAMLPVHESFSKCGSAPCEVEANLIVWPSVQVADSLFENLFCCDADLPENELQTCLTGKGIFPVEN